MTDAAAPRGITRDDARPVADDAVGVTLPVGFRATSADDGFRLVVRSRARWVWPIALMAIFWNGFLVVWFAIAIAGGVWSMALFATIHALVGVALGYTALRGLFNRVEIDVARGQLSVRHRPFPWFAPGAVARNAIDQLFVEKDESLRVNGRPVERYSLQLREKGGRTRRLFIVDELPQARYLEREIERAFHIEDRRVHGEIEQR